nr:hypothetical protein [Nocardia sp. BMG51109]
MRAPTGRASFSRRRAGPARRTDVVSVLRQGRMSVRRADRAIRAARTMRDLRGEVVPAVQDVLQALIFRRRGAS